MEFADDQEWADMNKRPLQIIEILVRSLDFDGFGRKFQDCLQLAEYFNKFFELDGNKIY